MPPFYTFLLLHTHLHTHPDGRSLWDGIGMAIDPLCDFGMVWVVEWIWWFGWDRIGWSSRMGRIGLICCSASSVECSLHRLDERGGKNASGSRAVVTAFARGVQKCVALPASSGTPVGFNHLWMAISSPGLGRFPTAFRQLRVSCGASERHDQAVSSLPSARR